MIECRNCHKKIPDNAKECPYCHFLQETEKPNCDVEKEKTKEATHWRKQDTFLFLSLGLNVFSGFILFPISTVFSFLAWKKTRFTHLRVVAICFCGFGLLFWVGFGTFLLCMNLL